MSEKCDKTHILHMSRSGTRAFKTKVKIGLQVSKFIYIAICIIKLYTITNVFHLIWNTFGYDISLYEQINK